MMGMSFLYSMRIIKCFLTGASVCIYFFLMLAPKKAAQALGIPVHNLPSDVDKRLSNWSFGSILGGPDPFDVGITISFGYFVPPAVLKQFRLGVVNLHASLLPDFRGAAPMQHQLLHGVRESGVTAMDIL